MRENDTTTQDQIVLFKILGVKNNKLTHPVLFLTCTTRGNMPKNVLCQGHAPRPEKKLPNFPFPSHNLSQAQLRAVIISVWKSETHSVSWSAKSSTKSRTVQHDLCTNTHPRHVRYSVTFWTEQQFCFICFVSCFWKLRRRRVYVDRCLWGLLESWGFSLVVDLLAK